MVMVECDRVRKRERGEVPRPAKIHVHYVSRSGLLTRSKKSKEWCIYAYTLHKIFNISMNFDRSYMEFGTYILWCITDMHVQYWRLGNKFKRSVDFSSANAAVIIHAIIHAP